MLIDFRKLFPKYGIRPTGVLHIGANVGEEAPIYHELGIQNACFVEANPEIFPKLESHLNTFCDKGRIYIALNLCASDTDGEEVNFHVSNNGSQSSSILELGTHKQQHPEVHYVKDIPMKTVRMDSIIAEDNFDYDFLNVDVQGAEEKVLRGMGDRLNRFKWLYLEVNKAEVYKGCPHVNDLDLFLNGFGFKRVETANWIGDWSDALYIKGI